MATTSDLPRWRLNTIYPDVHAPEFLEAVGKVQQQTDDLANYLEVNLVKAPSSEEATAVIEGTLLRFEDVQNLFRDISAFLQGTIDTDAFDDRAQAARSRLRPLATRLSILQKRFVAWLGELDLSSAADASELVREHSYNLRRFQVLAGHLMGSEAEEIAEVLDNTGGRAWSQLHSALIGRGTIATNLPGREEPEYNVAELKQLQANADRDVRRGAYRAELELLGSHEVSYAAAMNSIKGQVGELSRRRGWDDPLDESLFVNAMSRASLGALQQAVRESFPMLRRYMTAKARFLGLERLAWYDLFAPVAIGAPRSFGWDEAREFVLENFEGYSSRLSSYAARAFDEGWLDAPSRKGKVNGAYCMPIPGRKESRILLNFAGTLDDVFTIAHELGHGYHNDCMFRFGRTSLQRSTPMTLAETASIFCETIIVNAMLEDADDASKLAILEQDLVGTNQVVVDIDSRFRFENAVFEKRAERELSVDEMKGIMADAQATTYGEAVDPEQRHPLMWAHKGHYYSSNRSYYNYPYTFGLLFGIGLYRVYRDEPEGFQERYERLLSSTAMAPAADLGREFGIDIESVDFWRGSLSVFEDRVAEYESLVDRLSRNG